MVHHSAATLAIVYWISVVQACAAAHSRYIRSVAHTNTTMLRQLTTLLPEAMAASSHGLGASAGAALHNAVRHSSGYTRTSMHATTILCVRKDGQVVLIGDGQVTMGTITIKPNARKVRRIGEGVIVGFAGSAADGLSLVERLETKLEEHPGQLLRASVELAKQWRQDKALRFLQAELLVADASTTLTISGNGDVLEPHDGIMAIGSGGNFAMAAARALMDVEGFDAQRIGKKAMTIAADMCIHTNHNFVTEVITAAAPAADAAPAAS